MAEGLVVVAVGVSFGVVAVAIELGVIVVAVWVLRTSTDPPETQDLNLMAPADDQEGFRCVGLTFLESP